MIPCTPHHAVLLRASLIYPPLSQVAAFAQTTLGRHAIAALVPPVSQVLSERALEETRAVDALEAEFAADLDFGGVQTAQCAQALSRVSRGGLLSGTGLQAVASLLSGAAKLQRVVKSASREAAATGYQGLEPVTAAFKVRLGTEQCACLRAAPMCLFMFAAS